MSDMTSDPYAVYHQRVKGIGTRRIIEMVGGLHMLGYGQLRLACWQEEGPAPYWRGVIAPGRYFRRDHGALLGRYPTNDFPLLSSRHFAAPNFPWPGFLYASPQESAQICLERWPLLAIEGQGEDPGYVSWYTQMLAQTAPTGLIAAALIGRALPGYMYVGYGPPGVDHIVLPPPGLADNNDDDESQLAD